MIALSFTNFLFFHTLAEGFSIVIGVMICVVAWQTYSFSPNNFLMFLANGFFWLAVLDLVHTLSYKGMAIFPESSNIPTQLWVATRYLEAAILLIAPQLLKKTVSRHFEFAVFGIISFLLIWLIFNGYFPDAFLDENGLTTFKIYSEYAIGVLLIAAIGNYWRFRDQFEAPMFSLLVTAIILTIISELAFTFYISVYGISNMVGHIFKMLAFGILFIAILRTTLTKPYIALQHEVGLRRKAEDELKKINESLEQRVRKRTNELSKMNNNLTENIEQLESLLRDSEDRQKKSSREFSNLRSKYLESLLNSAEKSLQRDEFINQKDQLQSILMERDFELTSLKNQINGLKSLLHDQSRSS